MPDCFGTPSASLLPAGPPTPLILRYPHDNVILECNKLGSQAALKIDPVFDVGSLSLFANLFCESKNDFGTFGVLGLIVPADRSGGIAHTHANLNTIDKALLILAAAVELKFDFVIAECDVRHSYDLSSFDGLAVLLDLLFQLLLIDLARIGHFDAFRAERE